MTSIFVNLPSSDLDRSRAFYVALGARINPHFSDENGLCLVWSDGIYFMLLQRDKLQSFTSKRVIDPADEAQTIIAFTRKSRADVDAAVSAALAAGGAEHREPEDYGFMYQRAITDPDGNILEVFFMEPGAVERGPDAYMEEQGGGDS